MVDGALTINRISSKHMGDWDGLGFRIHADFGATILARNGIVRGGSTVASAVGLASVALTGGYPVVTGYSI